MDRMLWIPDFMLQNPDSMQTLDSSPWCFLVLRKKAILSSLLFCGVGIVQCLFNLVYYVTDAVIASSATPRN